MNDRPMVTIVKRCPFCRRPAEVTVYQDEFDAWQDDKASGGPKRFIQNAMPELPAAQREILISGSHPACFDAAFPEDDE
jgi:hypothetical protein